MAMFDRLFGIHIYCTVKRTAQPVLYTQYKNYYYIMYTLPSLVTFSLPCEIPIVVQLITNKCSYWLNFLYTLPSLVTFSLRDHLQVFLFPQLSAHSSLIGSCDIALRTKLHNKQSFLLTQVSANSSFIGQLSLTQA